MTDSAGERLLRSILEPLGWTVNRIEHDYGVDFEVEVFWEGRTTGVTFKVQLKSSRATKYSSGGDFISQTLGSDAATYLCQELTSPVILIHADVEQNRTFWLAPQLDLDTIRKLKDEALGQAITLRIPTVNELPDSLPRLVAEIEEVETLLATRVIIETPVLDFVSSIRDRINSDEIIREFKIKSDSVKLSQAQSLLGDGLVDEARSRINSVLSDPEASIGNKFPAVLILEGVEARAFREGRSAFRAFPEIKAYIADKLWTLVRNGPAHMKFYALIAREAGKLALLAERESALYINWVAHTETADILWKLSLVNQRARVSREIVKQYNRCLRLAQYASGSPHRWLLGGAILHVVSAISVFILRLRLEGLERSEATYAASALQLCNLAAQIAIEFRDDQGLTEAVLAAPSIDCREGSPALRWARATSTSIRDRNVRKATEDRLEWTANELRRQPPDQAPPFSDLRRMFEEMATALGIDLSDPNDPRAELVRIGIADLDPSRVLKGCEHIFISLGDREILAERLALPTAGNKIIHCDLHGHAIEGPDLDGTYALFKQRYCQKCSDSRPRLADWVYTEEWQQEENRKHVEFLADFNRRRNARRRNA
ncbi:MAG: DUF4365 domain-containing protein [Terriglobia bacterium]